MCGLSVGVRGAASVRLICRRSQAEMKVVDLNALPRSMVIDSGTMTGFAATCAATSASSGSIPVGRIEREYASDSGQPGCMVSGVIARASKTAASTALVATGRAMTARTVRVAISTAAVTSMRPEDPSG